MDVTLQALGENIKSGEVVRVLIKKGDTVAKDQTVVELETDKATVEVPSAHAGIVTAVHVKAGDKLPVGGKIFSMEGGGGDVAPVQVPPPAKESKKVVETSTASLSTVGAGSPGPGMAKSPPLHTQPKKQEIKQASTGKILASPSVRKKAREMGVDLSQVAHGGRVSMEDLENVSSPAGVENSSPVNSGVGFVSQPLPDFTQWGEVTREEMSNIRSKTAVNMAHAWNTIPHVTQHDTADITEVMNLRKRYAKRVEAAGGHLTVTAIILKVAASALKVFPQFSTSVNMEKQEIIYKKYCHIGVAVDTERGLLVPVIRDVDKKNIVEISVELNQAAERARTRKSSLDDLRGGVFTITNLGSLGTTTFTPIVRWPEVAILGIGRAVQQPVWQEDKWVPRLILPLSLSYDHRIIDGADAARFLRWIAEAVQEPFLMDLEG